MIDGISAAEDAPNRVLATPLLQQEDDESDNKSDKVALPKKSVFKPKTFASFPLFQDSSIDFCHLRNNGFRVDPIPAQVC